MLTLRNTLGSVLTLVLLCSLSIGAATVSDSKFGSVAEDLEALKFRIRDLESIAKQCVTSDCPVLDRNKAQSLLNQLQDAELFLRLMAVWMTAKPSFSSDKADQEQVADLRALVRRIGQLIYLEADTDASFGKCFTRLNEMRGGDNLLLTIKYDQNLGRTSLSPGVLNGVELSPFDPDQDRLAVPAGWLRATQELTGVIRNIPGNLESLVVSPGELSIATEGAALKAKQRFDVRYSVDCKLPGLRIELVGDQKAAEGSENAEVIERRLIQQGGNSSVRFTAPEAPGKYLIRLVADDNAELDSLQISVARDWIAKIFAPIGESPLGRIGVVDRGEGVISWGWVKKSDSGDWIWVDSPRNLGLSADGNREGNVYQSPLSIDVACESNTPSGIEITDEQKLSARLTVLDSDKKLVIEAEKFACKSGLIVGEIDKWGEYFEGLLVDEASVRDQ